MVKCVNYEERHISNILLLSDLFNEIGELQARADGQLGVVSYGISMTTLEEVFLKLGRFSQLCQGQCRLIKLYSSLLVFTEKV